MNASNLINRLVTKKLQQENNRAFCQPQAGSSARAICVNRAKTICINRAACVWSKQ